MQSALCLCTTQQRKNRLPRSFVKKDDYISITTMGSNDRLIVCAFNRNEWRIVNKPSDGKAMSPRMVKASSRSFHGLVSIDQWAEPVCENDEFAAEKPQSCLLSVQLAATRKHRAPIENAIENLGKLTIIGSVK